MQTRVQTIGTCRENFTTGERNARFVIRARGGELMTNRLRNLASEHVITYVPDNLLEDLVNGYNSEISKLELSDQYKLEFKSWPEGGHEKEQLIVDLIDRRHDLIKMRRILESTRNDQVKGENLFKILDESFSGFDDLWNKYKISSRGDISWNPVEGLTKKYSKLLATPAAEAAAKAAGKEVGGWL
ncbi:hypothetical protein IKW75_00625 [Candidatus Saccharibacteria bacterium]|nr:hypothetical protein [Candidatus Saccharibacteria bacterium]